MSLMKRMARIIQRDIKRVATRQKPYEEWGINRISIQQTGDYLWAHAYKDEQQNLWSSLYRLLNELLQSKEAKNSPNFQGPLEMVKLMIHNYDGTGMRDPGSQFNTCLKHLIERSEFTSLLCRQIYDIIEQIDWSPSE